MGKFVVVYYRINSQKYYSLRPELIDIVCELDMVFVCMRAATIDLGWREYQLTKKETKNHMHRFGLCGA
jgi:hypothetical protein